MPITYIIKTKRANPRKKDLPLLKNDITNKLGPQKPVIYSRYMHLDEWLNHLIEISKEVQLFIKPILGSSSAYEAFGVGAGGDIIRKIDKVAEETIINSLKKRSLSLLIVYLFTISNKRIKSISYTGSFPHNPFFCLS